MRDDGSDMTRRRMDSKKLVTILFLLIRTIPPILGQEGDVNVTSGREGGSDVVVVFSDSSGESSGSDFSGGDDSVSNETTSRPIPEVANATTESNLVLSVSTTHDHETNLSTSPLPTINSSSSTETVSLDPNPPSTPEPELPPLPPEKLQQSPLASLISSGSSESLQNFLKTRGFAFSPGDAPPDPVELNELLARLKPKQGRFDPALLDIINNGFLPSHLNIFGNKNNNKPEIPPPPPPAPQVNDADNIWSPSLPPKGKPHRGVRNRFSSKFSKPSNQTRTTHTTTTLPPPETAPRPEQQPHLPGPTSSLQPFAHITDPNLRNHRLYDWELEKNFTSIDQMEDLLADSSETYVTVVKKPSGSGENEPPGKISEVTTPGWIPRPRPKDYTYPPVRPISMEGTQFDSSGDLQLPSDTFLKLGGGSESAGDLEEDEPPFNLLRPRPPKTRPREPLRESSTENLVFMHGQDKRRYDENGVRSQEVGSDKRKNFRPSPTDKVGVSPPVFVDPDQDFFTSTIRNYDTKRDTNSNDEPPSFIRPMRRPQKGKGGSKDVNGYKRKRRPISEEAITDLDRDPRPYPPPDNLEDSNDYRDHRDRPTPIPSRSQEDDFTRNNNKFTPTRKSDRILTHPDDLNGNSESEVNPAYYNFYPVRSSQFGPASNERGQPLYPGDNYAQSDTGYVDGGGPEEYQENNGNYPGKSSSPIIGHNGEQIYAGGYDDKFHHPFAAADSQPEYSSYAPNSNEGWLNTYWILGGLIALSAISAFLIPTLLSNMGRNGKIRNDLQDENLEYDDQTSTSSSSGSSTLASLFGNKKKPAPSDDYNSDPTADSDLWTEIKGVYGDVVKIVRGDYGGIVDKLSGYGGTKDKDKIGPNIVYRDDITDDLGSDANDDDFDYETNDKPNKSNKRNKNKNKQDFGNRKGKAKPKSKKNRNITSSINYVVSNSSPGTVVVSSKNGVEVETSRSVPPPLLNDTMATFYLGPSSSSRPLSLFPSPPQPPPPSPMSDGFLGEWAKVQLIGS